MARQLVIDIGNTQTVLGLFQGPKILQRWRLPTRKEATADEITLSLAGLVAPKVGKKDKLEIAMASVVPALDGQWISAVETVWGRAPRVLNWQDCGGLELQYEIPKQIGADRLANVLGARALGHRCGIVIDFGTATTFDVFEGDAYLGGVICPGIVTSMRSFVAGTAKLSEPELKWPSGFIGKTTDEALRIGFLHGTVGMVEHLLQGLLAEKPLKNPSIIATGGLAGWVFGRAQGIGHHEPDITLLGLRHLLNLPSAPDLGVSGKTKSHRSRKVI